MFYDSHKVRCGIFALSPLWASRHYTIFLSASFCWLHLAYIVYLWICIISVDFEVFKNSYRGKCTVLNIFRRSHLALKALTFEKIEIERILGDDEDGRIENNIEIFGLDNACYTLWFVTSAANQENIQWFVLISVRCHLSVVQIKTNKVKNTFFFIHWYKLFQYLVTSLMGVSI